MTMTANNGLIIELPSPSSRTKRKRIRDGGGGSGGFGASYLLATIFLSGIVCFRLGTFNGCVSSWMDDIRGDTTTHRSSSSVGVGDGDGDDDDPDSPGYYRGATMVAAASTTRGAATAAVDVDHEAGDRRFVPRPSVPYGCGVVFFYHIPSTGGASINQWFRKYRKPEWGNMTYYQHWAIETKKDGFYHTEPEVVEGQFASGMDQLVRNLGPKEWRIAHSHLVSTYLNESEDLLYKWRSDVETQGCELINTIMLRDPLNHAMSLHKIVNTKNSTREEWTKYLSSPTGPGLWATVLDFFLYNNHGLRHHEDYPNGPGGRNPYSVTMEAKVSRAMELLHRHFDVVTVGDHAKFRDTILKWTGWTPTPMPRMNVHKREMSFTKKEVENLQKLLRKNGDIEFVDRAKLDYHDYLSYLAHS